MPIRGRGAVADTICYDQEYRPSSHDQGSVVQFYKDLTFLLSASLMSEKRELEKRLARLHWKDAEALQGSHQAGRAENSRRPYSRVLPKYRNPENPSETWSGRGKQPRWMAAALKSGRRIDDFLITSAANPTR